MCSGMPLCFMPRCVSSSSGAQPKASGCCKVCWKQVAAEGPGPNPNPILSTREPGLAPQEPLKHQRSVSKGGLTSTEAVSCFGSALPVLPPHNVGVQRIHIPGCLCSRLCCLSHGIFSACWHRKHGCQGCCGTAQCSLLQRILVL